MRHVRFRLITLVGISLAAPWASPSHASSEQTPAVPAVDIVRRAVDAEAAAQHSDLKFMFRDRKQTPNGSQTRLMAETVDAMAAMTIAYNDKPLTPEQRQGEMDRLHRLAGSPGDLKRKHQKEQDDADHAARIVRALPEAFLYDYAGTAPGEPGMGTPGSQLLKLNFRPNPDYEPPTHVEQVLTGMHGYVLIDPQNDRLAKIDGTLFKDVAFGWGILGHLDRGGRFVVVQGEVGQGGWEITRMDLSFTGKILLFKSINIQSTEVFTDFQPVPENLTFAQAVDLLAKREAVFAENASAKSENKQ